MLLFIFWASAAIIVYTYIGYPVTLMILAKIRAQPVKKAPFSIKEMISPARARKSVDSI